MRGFLSAASAVVLMLVLAVAPVATGRPAVAAGHDGPVLAHRVIDLIPGAGSSIPFPGTVMGDYLYFTAFDGVHGRELWRTNGTAAGTSMVVDITGDATSSSPANMTGLGDHLYFSANDGVHGAEVWRTDGTEAGTHLVRDVRAGAQGSSPSNLTAFGSHLYFTAHHDLHGRELWRSDGTEAGTQMVRDIDPAGSSMPFRLTPVGSHLFFSADDGGGDGRELWRTDGTGPGTQQVRDINVGPQDAFFDNPVIFKGKLHFTARNPNTGWEVWYSDGTQAGTEAATDIPIGPDTTQPGSLTVVGDHLYFSADDGALTYGRELWRTSGGVNTEGNFELVADINPGAAGSTPIQLTGAGEHLYFSALHPAHGRELWRTDGTPAGTHLVADIRPGGDSAPTDLIALGDHLYFVADDGVHGRELWRTDGTEAGTHLVADVMEGAADSSTERLAVFDGDLYFQADDGVHGAELWRVSALPEPGVVRYGGPGRFETAALLSAASFTPGVDAVYVATGQDFPDALTGAVAAALDGAPVLLVTRNSVPQATRDELERLQPGRIWILGGGAAIGPAVAADLAAYTAGPVERLSGPERFSTAAAVSEQAFPDGADVVYVSTGFNFPDALTGVPAAAAVPGPLLLVTTNQVPTPTGVELARLDPERIVVLGGTAAVSGAVAAALGGHADVVDRIAGPDRYATAAATAEEAFPEASAVHTVFVATGNAFPDALAAGAVAGAIPGPVLLSQHGSLPASTVAQLERLGPHRIVVMGGTAAISEAVEDALATYLAE